MKDIKPFHSDRIALIIHSRLAGAVGIATLGNLIGRAANVLIPLTVVGLYGANSHTDRFFFLFAVAFFFFGTLANAISDASVPLLISGRLIVTRIHILLVGIGNAILMFTAAALLNLFLGRFAWEYILALSLLSGAGMANGLASGKLLSQERFGLPGLTWLVRIFPLLFFIVSGPSLGSLVWLAVGIGLADWARLALMLGSADFSTNKTAGSSMHSVFAAIPAYGLVLSAAAIMGLNPLIDRLIAGISGPGAITILETAERIYGILATLCTIGISSVLLTHLSKAVNDKSIHGQWKKIFRFVVTLCAVWLVFGIASGWWGLNLFFDHFPALAPEQSAAVRHTYWFYLAGLPAFVLMLAYIKRLQAQQRWWLMVAAAVASVGLNIPFSLVLRAWLGVPGIALATSIIHFLILILLAAATHLQPKNSIYSPRRS